MGCACGILTATHEEPVEKLQEEQSHSEHNRRLAFQNGSAVKLHGLNNDFFNGLTGRVVTIDLQDPNGRIHVQLALPPCKTIAVKTNNLRAAGADAAASLIAKACAEGASVEAECLAADALKKEFKESDAQRQAANAIQAVAKAASVFVNSLPAEKSENISRLGLDFDRKLYAEDDPEEMEKLLECTTLIDAQYLLALGKANGVLPRWQEIPEDAKIDKRSAWRLRFWNRMSELPVLVLSYCWFSKEHPDPKGEQLAGILPILQIMVEYAKTFSEHCTIGVLQDYGSFPQWPRTREEKLRFDHGLKRELNEWYAHPNTIVLMLDRRASDAPEHTNRRLYDERGWCFTEKGLATIVKYGYAFWSLSAYKGAGSYEDLRREMVAKRPAPTSPEQFAETMRQGVESEKLTFTAKADKDFVIELYRSGFVKAFEFMGGDNASSNNVYYWHLGWGDEAVPALASAIAHVKMNCSIRSELNIVLNGNNFSEKGEADLKGLSDGDVMVVFD